MIDALSLKVGDIIQYYIDDVARPPFYTSESSPGQYIGKIESIGGLLHKVDKFIICSVDVLRDYGIFLPGLDRRSRTHYFLESNVTHIHIERLLDEVEFLLLD